MHIPEQTKYLHCPVKFGVWTGVHGPPRQYDIHCLGGNSAVSSDSKSATIWDAVNDMQNRSCPMNTQSKELDRLNKVSYLE